MFKKVIKALDQLIERISRLGLIFSGVLTLAMGFVVTYGVIKRYVFADPSIYVYELSMMFMISGLVFAVAYVQREGRHLRVDFLSSRMSQATQDIILNLIVPIAGLFYCIVLTWKGWTSAMYSLQIGETSQSIWGEPLFPVRVSIPVGYGLICLVLVSQICRSIAALKSRITKKGQ